MKYKRQRISNQVRQQVYDKYDGHCAYCGCNISMKELQVDHFAPVYLFGDNTNINNLMPSCRMCNYYKSTLTISKFREQLSLLLDRLNRDNFTYRLAKKYNLIIENEETLPIKFYYEKRCDKDCVGDEIVNNEE